VDSERQDTDLFARADALLAIHRRQQSPGAFGAVCVSGALLAGCGMPCSAGASSSGERRLAAARSPRGRPPDEDGDHIAEAFLIGLGETVSTLAGDAPPQEKCLAARALPP